MDYELGEWDWYFLLNRRTVKMDNKVLNDHENYLKERSRVEEVKTLRFG